ncbi:hypothetical protein AB0J38_21885 [Streptomyces sp. NPDC050095]|uniref:hypothetical protein n=1 Tax=unclassified Streptomyces TaxID=2593676 RepID=UPI00343327E8
MIVLALTVPVMSEVARRPNDRPQIGPIEDEPPVHIGDPGRYIRSLAGAFFCEPDGTDKEGTTWWVCVNRDGVRATHIGINDGKVNFYTGRWE